MKDRTPRAASTGDSQASQSPAPIVRARHDESSQQDENQSHLILSAEAWLRTANRLRLSARELEVVQHIFDGHSEARIAWLLHISPHTVHTYIKRIYTKLEVSDRCELILRVVDLHLRAIESAG